MGSPGNPTFFTRPPSDWNIIDYLNQNDPTSSSYNHQIVLERWTKTLTAIKNDAQCSPEQRDKAQLLLDQYKHPSRSSDRNRAREWHCNYQPSKKRKLKSGASVTIFQAPVNQGTFNNATFHQSGAGNGGRTPRAVSASCSVGDAAESPRGVYQADNVYQAPVNQGVFNSSTFNQAGGKRKLQDSEAGSDEGAYESDTHSRYSIDGGEYEEDEHEEGEHEGDEHEEDIAAVKPRPKKRNDFAAIYNKFVTTYKTFPTKSKFKFFCSGRVLEDVIFEKASALKKKSSAHIWVVDFDDTIVTSWFRPEELEELQSRILPLPEADKVFLASMARFSLADTAEEFRRVAEKVPYRPEEENYDRSKHFDAAWVNTVILSMLSILESPNNLLLYPNLQEGWFDCNPWSFLIDQCLIGLDGVLVQRKEIICLALKLIENISTPPSGKGSRGRRFDGIIHTLGNSPVIEYGAIEVAKSFESTQTTKWINDSTKLVQALRAMLSRLHTLVDHDEPTVKKLQVVGLLNAGLNMQIIRMNALNGNVFLLKRGKIRSVPTTVGSLKSVFSVMISISMFKRVIQDCVAVVKGYSGLAGGGGAQQTEQELFDELIKQDEL